MEVLIFTFQSVLTINDFKHSYYKTFLWWRESCFNWFLLGSAYTLSLCTKWNIVLSLRGLHSIGSAGHKFWMQAAVKLKMCLQNLVKYNFKLDYWGQVRFVELLNMLGWKFLLTLICLWVGTKFPNFWFIAYYVSHSNDGSMLMVIEIFSSFHCWH